MTKRRRDHHGQSWIEYALVIAAVVAALVVMQRYLKASVMGRWRQAADTFGGGQQFEPGKSQVATTE